MSITDAVRVSVCGWGFKCGSQITAHSLGLGALNLWLSCEVQNSTFIARVQGSFEHHGSAVKVACRIFKVYDLWFVAYGLRCTVDLFRFEV